MKQVKTVEQLYRLSMQGKCVIGNHGFLVKRCPAAFVISMQARMVVQMIKNGMFVYEAKK